jgi:hypothetical protein
MGNISVRRVYASYDALYASTPFRLSAFPDSEGDRCVLGSGWSGMSDLLRSTYVTGARRGLGIL